VFGKCEDPPPLGRDRCWLDPGQKRLLREVDGRIGLRKAVAP
jgi:hypothetical protein